MSDELASVEPDAPLYRLGRQLDPSAWPDSTKTSTPIEADDADLVVTLDLLGLTLV